MLHLVVVSPVNSTICGKKAARTQEKEVEAIVVRSGRFQVGRGNMSADKVGLPESRSNVGAGKVAEVAMIRKENN